MSLQWDGGGIHDKFKLSDTIGRVLICDDGIPRLVTGICMSNRYRDKAIVNEADPDSQLGHFIHLLSLSCQMLGYPLPDDEMKAAFSRYANALAYEQEADPFKVRWLQHLKDVTGYKEKK